MLRSRLPLALALLLLPTAVFAAGGSSATVPTLSPEQDAISNYNSGLKHNDKARELLAEAADATGTAREKLLNKAQKSFGKAARELRTAIAKKPDLYQAHSSLGYALRSMGEYEASLEAYDEALSIEPRYAEAIEYRAEAYLHLGRLDEVKEAYMDLFRGDRERAAELMTAMKAWAAEQGNAGSDPAVEEFVRWVAERSELSAQVGRGEFQLARNW